MNSKERLIGIIETLTEWECEPLLFLACRTAGGQQKYGVEKRKADWKKEMAEEAADFVNYFIWDLMDKRDE